MATILDLSFLKSFTDIFVWILVFVVVYGVLEVSNLLKNRGLHALFAFVMTAVVVLTGGGTNIITAMAPWFVVLATFVLFILMLGQFVGLDAKTIISNFGGRGVVWYIGIPLFVILIIAWTQGPQTKAVVDKTTGEVIIAETAGQPEERRPFLDVLQNPKVLGLGLILAVGAMTITLMAGGGGAIK